MKRIFTWLMCLCAISSCAIGLGGGDDVRRVSGIYTLQQVDGNPVPAAIAAQQGCNRTVREGRLTLAPGREDLLPHYTWSIAIDTDCDPVPSGVFQGRDDVGSWSFSPSSLEFESRMDLGRYATALEDGQQSELAVTVTHLGNAYRFVWAERGFPEVR